MTWVEIVGVIAFITNVWGNMMLVNLNVYGWAMRLFTNTLWMVHAYHTDGSWPLLLNHVVFFYINIHGWFAWRNKQKMVVSS